MSTIAAKPATTPIPVQLSDSEFTAFIFPHLSMPKRGPRCKIGYHRLFNLILWVLYTGMPWKCLPIPKGLTGKSEIHDTNVYRGHCQLSEADTVIRHTGMLPRSFLPLRLSAPYL